MTRLVRGESDNSVLPRGPLPHRRARIALLAVALSGALAASACSEAPAAEPTAGTIGSEAAVSPEGAIPATGDDPASDEPWSTRNPGGPLLASSASVADIRATVEETHGRTTDVALEIRRFAPFPDITTPERARIEEVRADVRDLSDPDGVTATAEVAFTTDGSTADLVDLYRREFTDRGWTESSDRTGESQGEPVRELSFAIPGSVYALDDVQLALVPAPTERGAARSMVRVRYVEVVPAGDPTAARFLGWADGMPLPEGPVITSAGIHTSSVGRNTLHFSLATFYEAITPETVADEVRQALPTGGYSERPTPLTGDATDNWVHLNNDLFDKSWVSTQNIATLPPSGTNPTRVNVAARVDFSPVAP